MTLYTIGYNHWPPATRFDRLVEALKGAGITRLVDVRHKPCADNLDPKSPYGPKDWKLQAGERGIDARLTAEGISYLWLLELGNPQTKDPAMAILRTQLASADEHWPVNRGLALLRSQLHVVGTRNCLLCACGDYRTCHRKVIAETLSQRYFEERLRIVDLS
jgi:uncharacterized protein (DUF488 family)